MKLGRRDFIYGTGSAAAVSILPASVAFADEYDVLRARWVTQLIGAGYDPNVEPYDTMLTEIGVEASTILATMQLGFWPNPPLDEDDMGNVTAAFSQLRTLAHAYLLPNTGFTNDATALQMIIAGLDYLTAHPLGFKAPSDPAWVDAKYQRLIGTPKIVVDILALLYSSIDAALRLRCFNALTHFVTGPAKESEVNTHTGGNRADIARVYILHGILSRTSTLIARGRDYLSGVFPYSTSGDGFYADGSFIQHKRIPYTGSYGGALLDGVAGMMALLTGSTWAITAANRTNAFQWVEQGYAPFIFNGLMMDGVAGRKPATGAHDHRRARGIMSNILLLAESTSATQRAAWRSMVKGWLQRDYWYPLADYADGTIPSHARLHVLLNDASVSPTAEPVKTQLFQRMDRAVHRRPTFCVAISMCSNRTAFYESINGENLHGWHANSGMTYWWGNTFGNGHYSDRYWATVDPYRLPGTTVSRLPLADAAHGDAYNSVNLPGNTWAGGVTDGAFAVLGQDMRGLLSHVCAKKSWFCLTDMVVCLGADIRTTTADGAVLETTIDNRNLGSSGAQGFSINGTSQSTSLSWSVTGKAGVRWTHLNGICGYVFYDSGGAKLNAKRAQCFGSWHDVYSDGSTEELERKYLTMWYDHGVDPTSSLPASYAYAFMPGATAAQTQARSDAGASQLSVLSNTLNIQAVSAPGFLGINFWVLGAVQYVSVDRPCSIMLSGPNANQQTTISVSDPTQGATAPVIVSLNRSVSFLLELGPDVSVVDYTTSRLRLSFNVVGKKGATLRAVVRL